MTTTIEQTIIEAAQRHGVDPTTALTIYRIEDPKGDPGAVNPKSKATGIGQFMTGTAKQYGLTDPTDPVASADAMARLIADNNRRLTQGLGRAPTTGEQYLAYQQGATGAIKLLRNPNSTAASLVGSAAITENGGTADMTAEQFAAKWGGRATQIASTIPPGSIPNVSGETLIGQLAKSPNSSGSPDDRDAAQRPPSFAAPIDYPVNAVGSGYSWGTPTEAAPAKPAPIPLTSALKNVSGSPDDRGNALSPAAPVTNALGPVTGSSGLTEQQRLAMLAVPAAAPVAPVPLTPDAATVAVRNAIPAAPVSPTAPAAAPPSFTKNGQTYVIGNTYEAGNTGVFYRANADGTFTKAAKAATNPTLVQVGLQASSPEAQANIAKAGATAAGIGNAASDAASAIGGLFGGLFGGGAKPGAGPALSPTTGSSALTESQRDAMLALPSTASSTSLSSWAAPYIAAAPQIAASSHQSTIPAGDGGAPIESFTPTSPARTTTGVQSLSDWAAPYVAAGAASTGSNSGAGSSAAQRDDSWDSLFTEFANSPSATPPPAAAPSTSQTVLNPAYTAWLKGQTGGSPFSNPGVQGLSPDDRDSPDGIARAVPGLSSPVFAKAAPPKYIVVKSAPRPALAPAVPVVNALGPVIMSKVQQLQAQGLTPNQAYNAVNASQNTGISPEMDANPNNNFNQPRGGSSGGSPYLGSLN